MLCKNCKVADVENAGSSNNNNKNWIISYQVLGRFIVLNATFNNISVLSWLSVLLVEETEVPGENQRPVASY